jgi:hypothetical protein
MKYCDFFFRDNFFNSLANCFFQMMNKTDSSFALNRWVFDMLVKDDSMGFLIGRVGNTEVDAIIKIYSGNLRKIDIDNAKINAGIFGCHFNDFEKFARVYSGSIRETNLALCYGNNIFERQFLLLNGHCSKRYGDAELLDPMRFLDGIPWTLALKSKKVLVIHPFSDDIKKQYNRREHIFYDDRILPDFHLITYAPVQSSGDAVVEFKCWFDAYCSMLNDISKLNFDIVLIGAGSYAMPLGSWIKKNMKKKVVVMGSAIQTLFGIKGKRWVDNGFGDIWYNDYWVWPDAKYRITGNEKIEGGCYW